MHKMKSSENIYPIFPLTEKTREEKKIEIFAAREKEMNLVQNMSP